MCTNLLQLFTVYNDRVAKRIISYAASTHFNHFKFNSLITSLWSLCVLQNLSYTVIILPYFRYDLFVYFASFRFVSFRSVLFEFLISSLLFHYSKMNSSTINMIIVAIHGGGRYYIEIHPKRFGLCIASFYSSAAVSSE